MTPRAQLLVALGSSAVLFLSIAFVFVLVIAAMVFGGLEFTGGPEIADAAATVAAVRAI